MINTIKSFFGPKEPTEKGLNLEEWIEKIQFGTHAEREAAIVIIPRFGEKAAPLLLRALRLRDRASRHAIVRALGKVGPGSAEILMELLASPGDEATENGGIGETVVNSKVTTVNGKHIIPTDLDWTVRIRCAECLGDLGEAAHFAMPLLKAIVKNAHEPREVRAAAADAAYKIEPDTVVRA